MQDFLTLLKYAFECLMYISIFLLIVALFVGYALKNYKKEYKKRLKALKHY